jgi:translation initiation factor 4A
MSTQEQREAAMEEFRSNSSSIMVTTNRLAQIEIQHMVMVVNFDLPHSLDHYVSRLGRGVLPNQKAIVINFITTFELEMIKELEGGFLRWREFRCLD